MLAPERAVRVHPQAVLARLPGFVYDGCLRIIGKKDQA